MTEIKRVQQVRASAPILAGMPGLNGQLIINTTTRRIHIMDQVNNGGKEVRGLEDDSVGTADLAAGAVTASKLASEMQQTLAAQIENIAASVVSNSLTVSWIPSAPQMTFRSPTLAAGTPVFAATATALSLVIPAGATLGTSAGVEARLALAVLYNAGSPLLAIVNAAGGVNLDETGLLDAVAIDSTADAADVVYASASVVGSPYRLVGLVTVTEAAAGTWSSAPSNLQGAGGHVLGAQAALGFGQRWRDMTASRSWDVSYRNDSGRTIWVSIVASGGTTAGANILPRVDGIQVDVAVTYLAGVGGIGASVKFPVPPGSLYAVSQTYSPALVVWAELR